VPRKATDHVGTIAFYVFNPLESSWRREIAFRANGAVLCSQQVPI
jgi:hypothetical protein